MAPSKSSKTSSIASKIESIKSETKADIKSKKESKNKKSSSGSSHKLVLMPVSSSQNVLYNVKELNKQFASLIEEATKAICELQTVSQDTVQAALQDTVQSVYGYALQSVEKGGKGKRKNKRVKDPNAPKKPLSNYMVFCMRHRSDIQAKHKDAKPTDISRLLGQQWNTLSVEQKAKYIDTTVSQ